MQKTNKTLITLFKWKVNIRGIHGSYVSWTLFSFSDSHVSSGNTVLILQC